MRYYADPAIQTLSQYMRITFYSYKGFTYDTICFPIILNDYFEKLHKKVKESDPRFPAHPNSAKHIGVHGLVKQTVHLLLHRQACSWKRSADIVLLRPQDHRLHPGEGTVFLKAQLQLLTDKIIIKNRFNHVQVKVKVQMMSLLG